MQLDNKERLPVAHKPDILTEARSKYEPSDITLINTVKIKLNNIHKGYESTIHMQGSLTISMSTTDKDIIPHLPLEFYCCEASRKNLNCNDGHAFVTQNFSFR